MSSSTISGVWVRDLASSWPLPWFGSSALRATQATFASRFGCRIDASSINTAAESRPRAASSRPRGADPVELLI